MPDERGRPSLERPPQPAGERTWTIMVVPDEGRGEVRQLTVSMRDLRRWLTLGAALLAVLFVTAFSLFGGVGQRGTMDALVEENLALKGRLRSVEATLDEVESVLERLRLYDAQLEGLPKDALPGMGPLDEDEAEAGGIEEEHGRLELPGEAGDPLHALEGEALNTNDAVAWASIVDDRTEQALARLHLVEARLGLVAESAESWRTRQAAMPTVVPVTDGVLTSGFGYRRSPFTRRWKFHSGLDISAPRGTTIRAPGPGTVLRAEWNAGYGRLLEIDHGYGVTTRYGHNSRLFVKAGEKVERGDIIATVGMTGRTTGPHLHWEVRVDGTPVDPLEFVQ